MSSTAKKLPLIDVSSNPDISTANPSIPRYKDRLTTELVFALVGPIGSGCSTTSRIVRKLLEDEYGYEVFEYHLSSYIPKAAKLIGAQEKHDLSGSGRITYLQDIGDKLRKAFGPSYLAAKCIEDIALARDKDGYDVTPGGEIPKALRRAHIIDSIKHKEELNTLENTYGDILWTIGVFAPVEKRRERLTQLDPANSQSTTTIIERDYKENEDHGQQVRDVFHRADFFLRNDADNQDIITIQISRFLEIIFGYNIHTPTTDESSMYAAHAEAAKSACLSRQVGAAIVNNVGDLIGLGRNDVPAFGGGLYTENHGIHDHRCHKWQDKYCHSDRRKSRIYLQIFESMQRKNLLSEAATQELVESAIKETGARDLIEFSRAVHAEMDAITSVARNHKPGIKESTIYVTAFPCHSCARHIVASGISKVIFIEPYPKSLALELHRDSSSDSDSDKSHKVVFLQFSGIAPKNILKLFLSGSTRKADNGSICTFNKKTAKPTVAVSLDDYPTHEKFVVTELAENERKIAQQTPQPTLPGLATS